MVWICAVVYVILFIFGKAISGRWLNLLSIFCGFYAVTIIFANLCLFGIYQASDKTCGVMIVGGIFFAIGYTLVSASLQFRRSRIVLYTGTINEGSTIEYNREFAGAKSVRNKFLIIALLVVLAYALYRLYVLLTLLRSGYTYAKIRTIYFNSQLMLEEGSASKYARNKLDVYLVQPLLLALIILSSINFFYNETLGFTRKGSSSFLILTFASAGLLAVSNGGREIIFYFILVFAFCYAAFRRKRGISQKNKFTQRQKRMLRAIVIVAVLAMIVMTFSRSKTGENSLVSLLRTVYIYFTGYLPNLSVRLRDFDSADYTHGYAFILGLIKLPAAIVHRVFDIPATHAYSVAESITSNLQYRVDIGGGRSFNAYVSPFFYFFHDYGYLSLIIESAVFGGICGKCEKDYESKSTVYSMFMYLFCFFLIISSMVRWEIVHPKTAMLLYYIPLIFNKYKRKDVIEFRNEPIN